MGTNENKNKAKKHLGEFGGVPGTLFFTLMIPIGTMALHILCGNSQCSFTRIPNFDKYKNIETFFNLNAFLIYSSLQIVLGLLKSLPFTGKTVIGVTNRNEKYEFCENGLFSLIFMVLLCVVLEAFNIHIFSFIYDHYFHFLTSSIIWGIFLSVYVYIASFYAHENALNHNALSNNIYSFFMGRELNPKLFSILDFKMFVLLSSLCLALLINTSILYKSAIFGNLFKWSFSDFDLTFLILYVMQAIYFIDPIVYESVWLTSFEVRYEGFGYMSAMGYLIYPFMVTSITKYAYEHKVTLCAWLLVIVTVLFLVGYVLFRGSNNQKNKFRQNPNSMDIKHLKVISTDNGKHLLTSGYWGFVRHPNYLGDIMMNLSWCPFVFCVPPIITNLTIILLLINRVTRDNKRCKFKYGPSWTKYCNKVKYALVPKVY